MDYTASSDARANATNPRIVGIGTAHPPRGYSQAELFGLFDYKNRVAKRVFDAPHIKNRYLVLPEPDPTTGKLPRESAMALNTKFETSARKVGAEAIAAALDDAGLKIGDIDAIVAVTSSGFMVPGLSCLFIRELGMNINCRRIDVVGMGCNAGLNGLAALDGWARQHPGKNGLMICCEVNSAIYCGDDTPRDAIVNSLFGDGSAAVVIRADKDAAAAPGPSILDFESHMIPDQWDTMKFDWHEALACWHFYLSRDIPYVLGVHCMEPINRLLKRNDMRRRDIDHWVIHTGGGAVIDAIKLKMGLTEQDVRHTRSVLRDYGNLSSGSFLFSYERLLRENVARPGEFGIMMTMGPGAQIETALFRW